MVPAANPRQASRLKTHGSEIELEAIGRFSETYPKHCKKSALLAKRAMDYLSNNEFISREQCHAKCMSGLALLYAGKTDEVKKLVYSWNTIPNRGIWVWPASYQCILLSEYYLATKDEGVLTTSPKSTSTTPTPTAFSRCAGGSSEPTCPATRPPSAR